MTHVMFCLCILNVYVKNQTTYAVKALDLNTTVPGKKKKKTTNKTITQIQIILWPAAPRKHILPEAAHITQLQSISLCSTYQDIVHCLNPLYISNSHCDQRTKRWHIWELQWTFGAEAARQYNPIDFVMWKDKGLLSSRAQWCKAHIISLCHSQATPAWRFERTGHYDWHMIPPLSRDSWGPWVNFLPRQRHSTALDHASVWRKLIPFMLRCELPVRVSTWLWKAAALFWGEIRCLSSTGSRSEFLQRWLKH